MQSDIKESVCGERAGNRQGKGEYQAVFNLKIKNSRALSKNMEEQSGFHIGRKIGHCGHEERVDRVGSAAECAGPAGMLCRLDVLLVPGQLSSGSGRSPGGCSQCFSPRDM